MTAWRICADIYRRGIGLRASNGRIQASGQLSPEERGAIRGHREEILRLLEDFEERAAILEYDAGLTRGEAERRARAMVLEAHRNAAVAVVRPDGVANLGARTTAPRPGDLVDAVPAASVRDDAVFDRMLDEMDGWPADPRSATFARAADLSRGGLSHDDAFLRAFAEIRGAELTSAPGVPHGPTQAKEGAR